MVVALLVVYDKLRHNSIITSGSDSHTTGLHPLGKALDFRTHDLYYLDENRLFLLLELVSLISSGLAGPSRITSVSGNTYTFRGPLYDVLLENFGEPNEHLHIEYDPKEEKRG